uniref:Uncharacterized protein n=1 Tax=viral metagenome TaxID=1070528 RepID=A0A6C0KX75_9ZZZZ
MAPALWMTESPYLRGLIQKEQQNQYELERQKHLRERYGSLFPETVKTAVRTARKAARAASRAATAATGLCTRGTGDPTQPGCFPRNYSSRVVPAPPSPERLEGGKTKKKSLDTCTVEELKERAKKRGVSFKGCKTKDDMIAKLRKN